MPIVLDVQTLIHDTGTFWSVQQVCDAINEAQVDLLARTKYTITTATISLPAGVSLVDIPSSLMIPQKIIYNNTEWYPTTEVELEQYSRAWRSAAQGQPKWFIIWDASHMRVWPRPDVMYGVTMTGVGWPTEVSPSVLDISAPVPYKDAVACKAAAILFEATRPDLAQAYEKESEEALLEYNRTNRNNMIHRQMRLRPGTAFNQAQTGSIQMAGRTRRIWI